MLHFNVSLPQCDWECKKGFFLSDMRFEHGKVKHKKEEIFLYVCVQEMGNFKKERMEKRGVVNSC